MLLEPDPELSLPFLRLLNHVCMGIIFTLRIRFLGCLVAQPMVAMDVLIEYGDYRLVGNATYLIQRHVACLHAGDDIHPQDTRFDDNKHKILLRYPWLALLGSSSRP